MSENRCARCQCFPDQCTCDPAHSFWQIMRAVADRNPHFQCNPVTSAIASGRAPTMAEVAEVVEESDAVAGERG